MTLTVPSILHPLMETIVIILTHLFIALPLTITFLTLDVGRSLIKSFVKSKPNNISKPKVVLITGASSCIGAALAVEYAAPGVTLGLLGRSKKRLNDIAQKCKEKGAECVLLKVDISDLQELTTNLEKFDDSHPIELLFANAGGTIKDDLDTVPWEDAWKRIIDVNYTGNIATIMTVFKRMKGRKYGQIAITSSIVGFFGIPVYCYYNSTKSALITFARDLRYMASFDNIKVSMLVTGSIATNTTQDLGQSSSSSSSSSSSRNRSSTNPDDLAKTIRDQLDSDTFCISWPFLQYLSFWSISTFPVRTKLILSKFFGMSHQKATGNSAVL